MNQSPQTQRVTNTMTLNHCMPDCHLQAEETLWVWSKAPPMPWGGLGDPQLTLLFYVPAYLSCLPVFHREIPLSPKAVYDVRDVERTPVFSGIAMGLSVIPGAAIDWLCDQRELLNLPGSQFLHL